LTYHTKMYSCLFEELGAILPITSVRQIEKGHGEVMYTTH